MFSDSREKPDTLVWDECLGTRSHLDLQSPDSNSQKIPAGSEPVSTGLEQAPWIPAPDRGTAQNRRGCVQCPVFSTHHLPDSRAVGLLQTVLHLVWMT